jgi:hypothetical protein
MINIKSNPVEWSSLMYELEDAKEHLESLIVEMNKNGSLDETEYEHQIGHVFAHLNRGWNSRNKIGDYDEKEREQFSTFPSDLEPCG